MSEIMRRFSDIDWKKLSDRGEDGVSLCLRRAITAYIKVRRDCQIVYCHYKSGRDAGYLPLMGFQDGLLFLRLDRDFLDEILVSGYCNVTSFSRGGLCIAVEPSVGSGQIGDKLPVLKNVELDHAFLIDKKSWEGRGWAWRNPLIPPVGSRYAPEDFVCEFEIGKDDLWFTSSDIEVLEEAASKTRELYPCPLSNKDRMPGIYWMFQAAYAYNQQKLMSKAEVDSWLISAAPHGTYAQRSIRTARKFVWLAVDRSKGGKGRGNFIMDDLDALDNREKYEFSFVSKGLSFILAIANWWLDLIEISPGEGNQALAVKLRENGFNGLEVNDLVYLISGSKLSTES